MSNPYTVVLAEDGEFGTWFVAAVIPGHHTPHPDPAYDTNVKHINVPDGDDVMRAAEDIATKE